MTNYEQEWDNLLGIKTTGRDDSISDLTRFPYEPTDYRVLEQVASTGLIGKKNTLLDYGCGKGRVSFFFSSQTKCQSIGIEYNPRLLERAKLNQKNAPRGHLVTFVQADAADFTVPPRADRAFFFNPFSVDILRKVMANLLISCSEHPREILLFFYYPSEFYLEYLAALPRITLVDTIDCRFGSEADPSEKLLIYQTTGY
ncbi:MAG: class I SAM-dependent methyltransferase [Selenomonas sp.]|nr:class I SAM-dependent methyltransferase [Selenomonas sp.]